MSAALSLSYLDSGFAILPVHSIRNGHCDCSKGVSCAVAGKHPRAALVPNGVKNATRNAAVYRQWIREYPNTNWAIATGHELPDGGFLLALDVDPRNGGDVTLASILSQFGDLPSTVVADTGGKGEHYLLRSEKPLRSWSLGPGLEVKGVGSYILVDPSNHVSGGSYAWRMGQGPGDVEIASAPAWLLEGAEETKDRPVREGDGTARDTLLGEAFFQAGMLGAPFADGVIAVVCPWATEHSDARGKGEDSSTVILPPAGGTNAGGFRCMHSHCSHRKWVDVVSTLPPAAVAVARLKYPFKPIVVENESVDESKKERPKDAMRDCAERLHYRPVRGGGYKLVPDIVNVITILSYDPRWKDVLRWDEFGQVLRFTREPPWHEDDRAHGDSDVWTDQDDTRLSAWFRRYWDLEVAEPMCRSAVYVVGRRESMNPLVDWLDSLLWDKQPRIDRWLSTYLGVEDNEYSRLVGAKWLISCVARAKRPGCKVDTALVLEGPQGARKSTAVRTLVPESTWFSDSPIEIGNKDAFVSLRGKWILELAELASLNRSEVDKVKAFFSSPCDSYRPPYGRELQTFPRRCVFVGTVNHGTYLRDETGGRRFWPVKCGVIDLMGLEADRDQLWAEATHRFNARERWWPEGEAEHKLFEFEQDERAVPDPWETPILEWLDAVGQKRGRFTAEDILGQCLRIERAKWTGSDLSRVTRVLTKLKCPKARWMEGKRRVRGYGPPSR